MTVHVVWTVDRVPAYGVKNMTVHVMTVHVVWTVA